MDYLPLFTRVGGAHCIVVGGGTVALRKAGALVRAGARVTAVAPEVCDELKALCRDSGGAVRERTFTGDDLDQAMLVIAATDDTDVNREVSEAAQSRQILVNVVDQPELCTVILPSIVDRSPLIMRLYGAGRSVRPGDAYWDELHSHFTPEPGTRQIIVLDIESVQTSCGYAVPRYDFVAERDTLRKYAENKGEDGMAEYRRENNRVSIDGRPIQG